MKDIYVSTEKKVEKLLPKTKIKEFLQVSMNVTIYFMGKEKKLKNHVKILAII